jgi:hypothetical protein
MCHKVNRGALMVTNFVRRVPGVGAACLVIIAVSVAVGGSGSAGAASQICDQFGSTTIEGSYVVQNNRSGSGTATQCIDVTDTGFAVTQLLGENARTDKPVGYPSVYLGCFVGNCSPGGSLPMQLSQINSATTSVSFSYVDGGNYDSAYDIFLDPKPGIFGSQQMEIMIHFNRQGSIKTLPRVGETTIGGRNWGVEQAVQPGGFNQIVYAAPSPISAWNFSVLDFINDARSRSGITDESYLNAIFAGFECWSGCAGVAVNSFSAAVN